MKRILRTLEFLFGPLLGLLFVVVGTLLAGVYIIAAIRSLGYMGEQIEVRDTLELLGAILVFFGAPYAMLGVGFFFFKGPEWFVETPTKKSNAYISLSLGTITSCLAVYYLSIAFDMGRHIGTNPDAPMPNFIFLPLIPGAISALYLWRLVKMKGILAFK